MEKLKMLREEANLTQEQVANIIGIHRSTYTSYEIARDTIPIIHLNKLCNFFNVSIDYVLGFTKEKTYPKSKNEINALKTKERLKMLRKEYKITQVQMAKILNISRSSWTYYESGQYQIKTLILCYLAQKYHYSIDYLLGKVDENHLKH